MAINIVSPSGKPQPMSALQPEKPIAPQKQEPSELAQAMATIVKQLGPKALVYGSQIPQVERLPTGVFEFDLATGGGFPFNRYSIVYGPESSGKCHARGDLLLMFSGKLKPVEDIRVGDLLMGPDSQPRQVQGTGGGYGALYRITPVKGAGDFTVNADHQLHLVCTHDQGYRKKGGKVQISVRDYLDKSRDWKTYHHLYRVGVEYPEKPLEVDPYFLGLWLGDGSSSNMHVYSVREEIIEWLQGYADKLGGRLSKYDPDSPCPGYAIVETHLRESMSGMGLFRAKHIPVSYMLNNRENRLKLLAGLIDTDGAKGSGSSCVFYNSNRALCNQVQTLAQSLGYFASTNFKQTTCNGKVCDSWFVYISMDDPTELPLQLEYKRPSKRTRSGSCLTSRFEVTPVGDGEFFGFEVDQDHLYLTGGFIVNHNTNLVYKAAAQAQRRSSLCNKAVFVDLEGTLDQHWGAKFGVDMDSLVVAKPSYGEQAVDMIDALVRAKDVAFLAVDSVAVMVAAREVEGSTEKADVGTSALLVKRLVNKLAIALSEEQKRGHDICVVLLNQTRMKIGVMFGDPETMPGGQTLRFNSSLTVRISGKNLMEKAISSDVPAFKETSCVVKKAKIGILQSKFGYNMAMVEHDGLMIGETDSFGQVKGYLQASGHLKKHPEGWMLNVPGMNPMVFKTLNALQDLYRAEDSVSLALQTQVIKNHAANAVLVAENTSADADDDHGGQ
jgi:RecA/RadA recombinase